MPLIPVTTADRLGYFKVNEPDITEMSHGLLQQPGPFSAGDPLLLRDMPGSGTETLSDRTVMPVSDWNAAPKLTPSTQPAAGAWDAAPLAGPTPQHKAVVSANDSGEEAAKALTISKQTGIPASVVQTDLPGYDAHARTKAAVAAMENPAIAAYVDGHPMAAKVSSDDYDNLSYASKFIYALQHPAITAEAQKQVVNSIPELAEALSSAPGRAKLFEAIKNLPTTAVGDVLDTVEGAVKGIGASFTGPYNARVESLKKGDYLGSFIDQFKGGGDAVMGVLGLASLPFMPFFGLAKTAIARPLAIAENIPVEQATSELGTALLAAKPGNVKLGVPAKGTVSFDEFMGTLRGMKTRQEINDFIKQKAEADSPPGALLQIEHAKAASEALDAAVEAAQESKTKIRSPDMFEDFAAAHGDSSLHIDAQKVLDLYAKEGKVPAEGDGLLGFIPDLAQKAQVAVESGGEVTVPVSKYLAHVDPAVHEGLKDSIRLHNDGVTNEEAKIAQDEISAYHGTISGDIKSFHEGTHFGSKEVANSRITDILEWDPASREFSMPGEGKEVPAIHRVKLKLGKTLDLPDLGEWASEDVFRELKKQGIVTDAEIASAGHPFQLLKDKGYDTIRYENHFEGKGEPSYIALNKKNITKLPFGAEVEIKTVSNSEVAKAKKDLFLNQLFKDAKSVSLTEPEFKKYSVKIEAANAAMIQKSIERDVAMRTSPEWKKNEAAVRAEVEDQLATSGPYAAAKYLKESKIELGPENADMLAPLFGYNSGRALIDGMSHLPDVKAAIDSSVKELMEARYGNRRKNVRQEARELALSEDWHGILADEVRILADAAGVKPALDHKELVQWSKDSFEASNIVDAANWEKLRRAVEKGGKEAEKALLKGDTLEAFKAKQRQMLAAVLAKESIKLQKEIDAAEKKIDRFASKEVIPSIDQAHLEQIRQMLASVGVPQQFAPLEGTPPLRDFVADAEGQIAAAPWLMDGTQPKLQAMFVAQFRAFTDTMKSLEHVGRLAKTVENARGKAELQNVVFDIKKELERFAFIDQPLNATLPQRAASLGRRIIGAHLLVERMLDYTDKFNPHGPITEYLDRPLRDSNAKEITLTEQVTKRLRDLAQHTDASINELIDNKIIPDALAKSGFLQMNRGNLRQLMLNMGNETNIKKVVEGFSGVSRPKVGPSSYDVSESSIWKLIDDNATAKDWKWVQGVWDIFAYLKPEADAMQLRDTGVPVDAKTPRAISNAHGEFTGGYYPIVYDRFNSDIQGHMATKNPIFAPTYVSATTPHGYTEQVTGYKGALDLTGSFLATRLQGMVHDIAFREAIRNANKLISNQELRTAIAQRWGKENAELLPGWLKDIANSNTLDDNYAQGIARAMAIVRQNTISTLIAFNPGTYIKHGLTAALLSADQVGAGALASAAKDIGLKGAAKAAKDLVVRDGREADEAFMDAFKDALDQGERGENVRQFIMDSSPVMRNRQRQYDDSIRGAVDAMNKAGTAKMLADVRQQAMLYGRLAVAYSDSLSAQPTWYAAYKKAYLAGETHEDAVFIADKAVSRAHGSNFVGDQPLVTRLPNTMTGELARWFVPLYKFWNHVVNNNLQLAWDAAATVRGPKPGETPEPGANAANIAKKLAVILGTIFIEEQATAALDDDKQGALHKFVMASLRYFGGGIIGVREATNALAGGYEPSVGLFGTVMKAGAQTLKDIASSTSAKAAMSKDWLIHTATAIGMLTGVGGTQVGKTGSFIKDLATGQEHPQGFNAYRQGFRTGHSKARKF